MDNKLLLLKLFLDELNIAHDIGSVNKRLGIQKGIYLGQLTGVDLKYRYGWYVKGPYCSELADDYYALNRRIKADSSFGTDKCFTEKVREKLSIIKPLLTPDSAFPLGKEKWLELLASMHYILVVQKNHLDKAKKILESSKPDLAQYAEIAQEKLNQFKLLGNEIRT